MNLIMLSEPERDGNRFTLTDDRAEHIRSVLKLKAGDSVEIGLINGPAGTAIIESVTETSVCLNVDHLTGYREPFPLVDLIVALPRPQTLKKVLWICGTMGVRRLHLIRANRVEKSYYDSPLLETGNYERFLLDGMSQGKQTRKPEVYIHERFKPFFEDQLPNLERDEKSTSVKLLCEMEATASLGQAAGEPVERLLIAVGPEGGWVPFETELMASVGFHPFSLGRWVLRVESAVTAALAQVEQLLLDQKKIEKKEKKSK